MLIKNRFSTYFECEAMMCRFKWRVEWSQHEKMKIRSKGQTKHTIEHETEKITKLIIGKLHKF